MTRAFATAALVSTTLLVAGCAGFKPGEIFGSGPGTHANSSAAPAGTLSPIEAKRLALANAMADTGVSVLSTADGQLQVNVPSDFSFGSDHAEILAVGRPVLDNLAANLQAPAFVAMRVQIVGYTDSLGSAAANETLSLARANSVRRHLLSKGVAANRIEVEGRGERDPLAPNDKAYGRALNRRVEIYLREP